MFMVAPNTSTESLLANACESMASASVMLSDFAGLLDTPYPYGVGYCAGGDAGGAGGESGAG